MVQALFNGNDFDFAECAGGKILDGEAASCWFAREAVSYTHLDVYKRQDLPFRPF